MNTNAPIQLLSTENHMETIIKLFQEAQITLSNTIPSFYPGSCHQCDMHNHGNKTHLIDIAPDLRIVICNKCYATMRSNIHQTLQRAQEKSAYNYFKRLVPPATELDIPHGFWYESGWTTNSHYKVFPVVKGMVYIPVVKDQEQRLIPMKDLLFLNKKEK